MQVKKYLFISESSTDFELIQDMTEQISIASNGQFVQSPIEAINAIGHTPPDFVILSTKNLDEQELELINNLNLLHTPIIIISEKKEDALLSYENGLLPVDFILKSSNSVERMTKAIGRALRTNISKSVSSDKYFIFLKIGRSYRKFLFDDIIYIEAYGIYSKVYTPTSMFVINEPILSLEEKLSPYGYFRIHKSYIINIKHIVSFRASSFEMTLGDIPIGSNYKHGLEGLLYMLKSTYV